MRFILSIDPRDRAAVRRVVVGSDAPDLPVRTEMASQDKYAKLRICFVRMIMFSCDSFAAIFPILQDLRSAADDYDF
jgi:hypothetical protein